MNKGVISRGIVAPMIKEGDDIVNIVTNAVLDAARLGEKLVQPAPNVKGLVRIPGEYNYSLNDKDVIGITESVIARASGQYISVDDIADWIDKRVGRLVDVLIVDSPIYSRNRFSMILKGFARFANKIYFVMPPFDEVGNPSGVNPFTGVDIQKYYKEICDSEGCESVFVDSIHKISNETLKYSCWIYCGLHDYNQWYADHKDEDLDAITLADICDDRSPDWGLLGTNKSTEEKLKLFPSKAVAQKICDEVKANIREKTGKDVIVMAYGDGCFKSPAIDGVSGSSIWEFADPVTSPAYTDKGLLESSPNEIKLKAFIDDGVSEADIKKLIDDKDKNLVGSMSSQGTTPRQYKDLLASLMDLTSGSGERATPIVLVQNYFKKLSYKND